MPNVRAERQQQERPQLVGQSFAPSRSAGRARSSCAPPKGAGNLCAAPLPYGAAPTTTRAGAPNEWKRAAAAAISSHLLVGRNVALVTGGAGRSWRDSCAAGACSERPARAHFVAYRFAARRRLADSLSLRRRRHERRLRPPTGTDRIRPGRRALWRIRRARNLRSIVLAPIGADRFWCEAGQPLSCSRWKRRTFRATFCTRPSLFRLRADFLFARATVAAGANLTQPRGAPSSWPALMRLGVRAATRAPLLMAAGPARRL